MFESRRSRDEFKFALIFCLLFDQAKSRPPEAKLETLTYKIFELLFKQNIFDKYELVDLNSSYEYNILVPCSNTAFFCFQPGSVHATRVTKMGWITMNPTLKRGAILLK